MLDRQGPSGSPSGWRSPSPNPQIPRRRVPYSLRSLSQRFHQVGAIEDSLFSTDPDPQQQQQHPFDGLMDLSVEKQEPSSSTSTGATFFSRNRGQSGGQQTWNNAGPSTAPPPLQQQQQQPFCAVVNPINFAPASPTPIRPQFYKASPFASFPVGQQQSGGDAAGVAVVPAQLTRSEADDMFDKWTAAFSPQTTGMVSSTTTGSRPSSSASASSLRFSVGSRPTPGSEDQPINLSRPSSITLRSTPNCGGLFQGDAPLDLRSPGPSSRTTTPVASPTVLRSSPRVSPYPGKSQQTANQMFQMFGTRYREKMKTFMANPASRTPQSPPKPVALTPTPSVGGQFGQMASSPRAFTSTGSSVVTADTLQETTRRLHGMSLRSHSKQAVSTGSGGGGSGQAMETGTGAIGQYPSGIPSGKFQPISVGGGGSISGGNARNDRPVITLHYPKPQQPLVQNRGRVGQGHPPQQKLLLPPPPPISTFRGLATKVNESSFSVMLTDKLEENYLKCRSLVMSRQGALVTPLKFLTLLCNRMQLNIHAESFRFQSSEKEVQFRTELYVGGFCGVGHGLSIGFSKQLAAAHVLERMRIHFRGIKQTSYALFPGNRYTKIGEKLETLCKTYDLGEMKMVYRDRMNNGGSGGGNGGNYRRGGGGGAGWNSRDLEVRWECSCFVKKYQAIVLSDHMQFGGFLAAKDMYLNFVKPPEVPVVQIKDYFAVGVDCPMLKDIHCSLLLNRPSINKLNWMAEYQVPSTQLDAVLNDPMNDSRYLMGLQTLTRRGPVAPGGGIGQAATLEGNKLIEFRRNLEEALEWIQTTFRRNNLQGMRFRHGWEGGRGGSGGRNNWGSAAPNAPGVADGGGGMMAESVEVGGLDDRVEVDENDAEVEDIFHDAIMDVELM